LGAEDTSAPYSVSWNTTSVANGNHILTAAARDAAGNITTAAAVTVNVSNSVSTPTSGSQTLVFTIQSGADDVYEDNGIDPASNHSFFGFWNGLNETSGLRFSNVTIPKGATISNAFLTLRAMADDDSSSTSARVRGIAADNATAFTSASRPSQGPFTSATVAWTSGPWSAGTNQTSPNLASVIQEITSRPNWVSGNALALSILNNGTTENSDRGFFQYEAGSPATLTITFTTEGTTPGDITAPTVSISSPGNGATVSGAITIAANAADNVGVVGVQFKLDGNNLGAEDTAAPHSASWDTTSVANGNHILTAIARDAAANSMTSTPVTVSVSNSVSPPPIGSADFQTRCGQSGVVKCVGFDQPSDISNTQWGANTGIDTGGASIPVLDSSMKASGNSSIKFTIPSNSGANTSGSYWANFSTDLSTQFGENSDFYVQWRQRFSPEFLTTIYQGGGGWKQAIIGTGDKSGCTTSNTTNCYASCTALEVVTQNISHRGFAQMYNSCTGSASHGSYDGFTEPFGTYDFKLQNARPSPYCLYSQSGANRFPPNGNCFGYVPNEWMTFQVRIKTGPRVGNEFTNSYVELWIAREGNASEQAFNWGPYNLSAGSSGDNERFGKVWLLPYNTGKSSSYSHPTAYTWYDELIISRTRIPDPGGSTLPAEPPAAPSNLSVQ
jgi:hypothetical protein